MGEIRIGGGWKEKLAEEFEKPYFRELSGFIHDEYRQATVYPEPKNIFRAFDLCPFQAVKVVILGQDPYHGEYKGIAQANGLCFAVSPDVAAPPSLQNIFRELESDLGHPSGSCPSHIDAVRGAQGTGDETYKTYGKEHVPKRNEEMRNVRRACDPDLARWAQQGVLLLNATLTVRASNAGSHQGRGWERFTDAAIKILNDERAHLVFILWGNYARQKGAHIDRTKHLVIESAHPSPFSAYGGFFGSKPFSRANAYLREHGEREIEW